MNNESVAIDTRREARYRLTEHKKECVRCAGLSLAVEGWEEEEDAAIVDALGAAE